MNFKQQFTRIWKRIKNFTKPEWVKTSDRLPDTKALIEGLWVTQEGYYIVCICWANVSGWFYHTPPTRSYRKVIPPDYWRERDETYLPEELK